MAAFHEWEEKALSLLRRARSLAGDLGLRAREEAIGELMEGIAGQEWMVVAAGEARRGKSMLLNALLGERDPVFPVDAGICTNVVTVARYGETERAEALVRDKGSEGGYRKVDLPGERAAEYVSERGNPENYKDAVLVRIFLPNPFLEDGILLADTPGSGSFLAPHEEAARRFLPKADLLLFVCDACAPMGESELSYLKEACRHCGNILFPLTKKDANEQYFSVAEENRGKISRALGIPEEEVKIIPVSSVLMQKGLETGRQAMCERSNFAQLNRAILERANEGRAAKILPFLAAAKEEVGKIQGSLPRAPEMDGQGWKSSGDSGDGKPGLDHEPMGSGKPGRGNEAMGGGRPGQGQELSGDGRPGPAHESMDSGKPGQRAASRMRAWKRAVIEAWRRFLSRFHLRRREDQETPPAPRCGEKAEHMDAGALPRGSGDEAVPEPETATYVGGDEAARREAMALREEIKALEDAIRAEGGWACR